MIEKDKRLRSFPKNVPIIREADEGDSIYFLVKGRAVVMVNGREVHEIGPGEFFGEIAGILGTKRTADVMAMEFCKVYEFHGLGDNELIRFLREGPGKILGAFVKGLAAKLVDSSRAQGKIILEQEKEIQMLRKSLSGTLAVVEKAAAHYPREKTLKEVLQHLKGTSGVKRGDVRNIEGRHLYYLRDVIFPKKRR